MWSSFFSFSLLFSLYLLLLSLLPFAYSRRVGERLRHLESTNAKPTPCLAARRSPLCSHARRSVTVLRLNGGRCVPIWPHTPSEPSPRHQEVVQIHPRPLGHQISHNKSQNLKHLETRVFPLNPSIWGDTSPSYGYRCFSHYSGFWRCATMHQEWNHKTRCHCVTSHFAVFA